MAHRIGCIRQTNSLRSAPQESRYRPSRSSQQVTKGLVIKHLSCCGFLSDRLLARLSKQLDERPALNILLTPEWVAVRTAMIAALAPDGGARR